MAAAWSRVHFTVPSWAREHLAGPLRIVGEHAQVVGDPRVEANRRHLDAGPRDSARNALLAQQLRPHLRLSLVAVVADHHFVHAVSLAPNRSTLKSLALAAIVESRNRGLGILYIDQNVSHVLRIADRIVVLEHGRLIKQLKAAEVTENDVSSLFVSS